MLLEQGQRTTPDIRDRDGRSLGQGHIRREILDELDPVGVTVRCGDLARDEDCVVGLEGVHTASTQTAGDEGMNPRPRADAQDYRIRTDYSLHRCGVRVYPLSMGEHHPEVEQVIHGRVRLPQPLTLVTAPADKVGD
jgi:hypothetical protein